MQMDKSWISIKDRVNNEAFKQGLENFLEFSYRSKSEHAKIKCPCTRCRNSRLQSRDDVYSHVIVNGFLEGYTNWVHQGEEPHFLKKNTAEESLQKNECNDGMEEMIREALFSSYRHDEFHENMGSSNAHSEVHTNETEPNQKHFDENTERFFKLLKNAECELFPGCKTFSTLSFIVRLLHVKSLCRWSNNSFTMLMEVLNEAFQHNEMFPNSYRQAWNMIKELGLEYKKIHACPNDCMLYWKETENDEACKYCKTSRYKPFEEHVESSTKRKQRIPEKVVRYFPLKPRLQRLFMSSKTSHLMRWHAEERIKDGKLRHPADSRVWRSFDEKYPDFAADCRNVRLGLATDGFNPFKSMSNSHSTWPIILIPYNLPPGRCMKQPSIILSTLIDGPRGPGNDIDVYLQPLIDELKDLWFNGVPTYDATGKCMFQLRAALFWTINDFPAYAMVSGWSTKGAYACPSCNKNCRSRWLKYGKKHCYLGHRRFLPSGHKYRNDRINFDGSIEKAPKPERLSGSEILGQLEGMVNNFGKYVSQTLGRKRKQKGGHENTSPCQYNSKKLSIFFQLPYWKENLVPHNLDIMHIEKNVMENILWTLLGVSAKTKDNLNSRLDLQELGLRKSLHPQREGDKIYLPTACFTMSKEEKDVFLRVLKNVKVPDGYASNISKCVHLADRNIYGLKSHDCHILMQQLLPVALRRTVPKHVCKAIIGLCDIFKQLYSKIHSETDFECLEERVALVLCELEKIFPPSFFDVMEHLPIHLPEEAKLAGPVQFRSMYPIERYLCGLKNYVRTRSHPEGSIAEGYLAEECMTFCSMYLSDVESKLNRPSRNDDNDHSFTHGGRNLVGEEVFMLDEVEWIQAHRYILNNLSIVDKFKRKHLVEIQRTNRRMSSYDRQKLHAETFHDWFKIHVSEKKEIQIEQDIAYLVAGPSKWARRYTGYVINGLRFHTKNREMRRKTQNSGVFLTAATNSFSSSKDKNPRMGDVSFYGVLQDIIEVRYTNDLKFVLFKCDWVDYNVGLRHDEFNFTLVNFNHLLYRGNRNLDEPFILASQAQQAWYIQDPVDPDWHVALKMTPRTVFNVDPEVNEFESIEDEHISTQDPSETNACNESISWARVDVDRVTVIADDVVDQAYVGDLENDDVDLEDSEEESEDITSDQSGTSDDDDDDDLFEE